MQHQNKTSYLLKELDFLKLLITRFHEQEKIAELELDIALVKTQEIYEHLLKMKLVPDVTHEERQITTQYPASVPPAIKKEAVRQQQQQAELPKKKEHIEPTDTKPVATKGKVTEPIVLEEVTIIQDDPVLIKKEAIPLQEEKNKQDKAVTEIPKSGSGILAEKISPTYHPINETLAQQKSNSDLSSRLQTSPLSSIVSGIGLNDKFLYIRELFQGDNVLYSNTIRHLDTVESLADAMDFIRQHFDWDKEDDTTQKFINLVTRRHKY